MEFMSAGWRDYIGQPGSLPGGLGAYPLLAKQVYVNIEGDKLRGQSVDPRAPLGTSAAALTQRLDKHGIDAALLTHDTQALTPMLINVRLSVELARATNDWTIERWLDADPRLSAAVLVPTQLPEQSVQELYRVGKHPQVRAVLLCANGLGKPFGHLTYRPILRAAADLGLVVVIKAGGDNTGDSTTHPTAHGLPSTYAVYHSLLDQSPATHLTSLIAQGAFDELPDLRVMIIGAGISWIAPHMWRFDHEYREFRREAPWLKAAPTHYLEDRIRISTYPLEHVTNRSAWERYLQAFPGLSRVVVYGSGYPSWDSDEPDTAADRLPAAWRDSVLGDNAAEFFDLRAGANSSQRS
jgi:predicted TIM-barrel fold metal-dependent hydrolase